LLGWYGTASLDQGRHDTAGCLDAEGQGRDVDEQDVVDDSRLVACEDGGLDGGTVGDGLVWVDALVQLLAVEEVLQQLLDFWNGK
jgi:hypothetical protein